MRWRLVCAPDSTKHCGHAKRSLDRVAADWLWRFCERNSFSGGADCECAYHERRSAQRRSAQQRSAQQRSAQQRSAQSRSQLYCQ